MGKRGKLVFKDDKPKKKSHTKKHKSKEGSSRPTEPIPLSSPNIEASLTRTAASSSSSIPAETASATPRIEKGQGTITVSGAVVTGTDTRFTKQLQVGDAILVQTSPSQPEEMRVVTMCLSDTSLSVSSAFSNRIHQLPFSFIPKPKSIRQSQQAKAKQLQQQQQSNIEQQHAFGIYNTSHDAPSSSNRGGTEFVYRQKTEHGSYRIVKEKVDNDKVTRSDLLLLRTKKKSDKYC